MLSPTGEIPLRCASVRELTPELRRLKDGLAIHRSTGIAAWDGLPLKLAQAHNRAVGRSDVLAIAEAPNWALLRFGFSESDLDLRILRGALGCEHLGISYLRFGAGWRLTLGHRHPGGGEEVYVLVEGSARIKIEDEILHMDAPSAVRVPGEQFRAIRAEGDAPAVFVVAGYPIDAPADTEFAPDFWAEDA